MTPTLHTCNVGVDYLIQINSNDIWPDPFLRAFSKEGVLGILPQNTAKTAEGCVFTGFQGTINSNLAQSTVSSSAFGSKNEQPGRKPSVHFKQ